MTTPDSTSRMYSGGTVHGGSAANSGFLRWILSAATSSDLDRQLFVAQNFGPDDLCISSDIFESKAHRASEVALQPDVPEPFVFDLPAGQKGILRAVLSAETDYLPADDEAFCILEPLSKRSILVVDGDGLTLRALVADPRFDVVRATSERVTPETLESFDAVLFMDDLPFAPKGVKPVLVLEPWNLVTGPLFVSHKLHGGPIRILTVCTMEGVLLSARKRS